MNWSQVEKECTYIPRSDRKYSKTGGHSSRTCGNCGNTNQGNAHLHRELIWTVVVNYLEFRMRDMNKI